MLTMSRKPQDKDKIQAPSIPEVKDEFHILAKRIGRKVSFRDRKLGAGPLLNALVIHFLSLPEQEQVDIATRGASRYEELLESDVPLDDPRLVAAAESPAADDEPSGKIAVPICNRVVKQLDAQRKHKASKPRG